MLQLFVTVATRVILYYPYRYITARRLTRLTI